MEEPKEKQCDCGCHTSPSSSEEMRRNGCDLCYSGSEYYPRHKEQPRESSWDEEFYGEFVTPILSDKGKLIGYKWKKYQGSVLNIKQFIQEQLDEQKENIREYCLDERDKAEKEKDADAYAEGYFIAMNSVVKYIDRL